MIIALDYDGTYTRDPELWERFIDSAISSGHQISCVTMRYPQEEVRMRIPVVYTSRQAKMLCFKADIWIDDNPHFLVMGG